MARTYVGYTFDDLFGAVVDGIGTHPDHECSPRGQRIRELIAPTLVLTNPRARLLSNPAREANYGFAVGEFLWYWAGRQDLKSLAYYNKRSAQFSDDGVHVNSAYGYRTRFRAYSARSNSSGVPWLNEGRTQWEACIRTLVEDRDSRRALLIVNEPGDNVQASYEGSKDVPCTLSLQFFIRDRKLVLHAHMRSNDAVWGLTYDLFSFTLFQECMLNELRAAGMTDLTLGDYIHTVGSLHIYDRHFEMASAVGKSYFSPGFVPAPPMDPVSGSDLARLVDAEEALRTGKVEQLGEAQFGGGARWMAEQLNAHRRKRDDERRRQVGPGDGAQLPGH